MNTPIDEAAQPPATAPAAGSSVATTDGGWRIAD